MKISFTSHGGWTATLRQPPRVVDTAALPVRAASEAEALARAAEGAGQAAPEGGAAARARAPEAMTYEITLEYADRTVTLKGSDVAASPEFMALCDWMRAHTP